eukprot:CAMPEP_0182461634 /NCGR_PEP_ID=MMETSP1319-20130603/6149_1 /TAXON_ID=172717 /ORGANISM="Bolidomonas pacifica, Strain RCC208" /LENGTH=308 /DNA_ID=CAMNT_0024660947 /DNA_START=657 /DNA_END=1580 /DNA_ORIENTATION=-
MGFSAATIILCLYSFLLLSTISYLLLPTKLHTTTITSLTTLLLNATSLCLPSTTLKLSLNSSLPSSLGRNLLICNYTSPMSFYHTLLLLKHTSAPNVRILASRPTFPHPDATVRYLQESMFSVLFAVLDVPVVERPAFGSSSPLPLPQDCTILLFPEGVTTSLPASRAHAARTGRPHLKSLRLPRRRAATAALAAVGLPGATNVRVYSLTTVRRPQNETTVREDLVTLLRGLAGTVHFHVAAVEDMFDSHQGGCEGWIDDLWVHKDRVFSRAAGQDEQRDIDSRWEDVPAGLTSTARLVGTGSSAAPP